jgi:hypothetical protein
MFSNVFEPKNHVSRLSQIKQKKIFRRSGHENNENKKNFLFFVCQISFSINHSNQMLNKKKTNEFPYCMLIKKITKYGKEKGQEK